MTLVSQRLPSAVQTRKRPLDSPEGSRIARRRDSTLTLNNRCISSFLHGGDFEIGAKLVSKSRALAGEVLCLNVKVAVKWWKASATR